MAVKAAKTTPVAPPQESAPNGAGAGKAGPPAGGVQIVVPPLQVERCWIMIEGTSPLVTHNWSKKAKEQMAAKQQKRAAPAREAKDPEREYREAMYRLENGGYGFPSRGLKAAMVRAGTYLDLTMTFLRGCFHIDGEMVEVFGEPHMREDPVTVGKGTADLRYRPEFKQWRAWLPVRYNARVIRPEQLINLINNAGFSVGIGEWRPEKDGQLGTFEAVTISGVEPAELQGQRE